MSVPSLWPAAGQARVFADTRLRVGQEKETLREVEKIATRLSNESAKQPSTA